MWWEILSLCLVCFLSAGLCETPTYKKVGSEVTLSPDKTSAPVKSVLWKQGNNLAMEYHGGPGDPLAYQQFKKRGSLNTPDGAMTITGLTRNDSGLYTVEINDEVNKNILLQVIAPVVKPNISISCGDGYCNLTCEGKAEEAEPVTYIWIFDKKHTVTETEKHKLTKDDDVELFQCELENPVSSQQSDTLRNPLTSTEGPASWTGIIVGVVVLLLLFPLIWLGLAILHKRGTITFPFGGICPAQDTASAVRYDVAPQHDNNAAASDRPEAAAPGKEGDAANRLESVTVEPPGPLDDPTQRPNGTEPRLLLIKPLKVNEAAPGKDDNAITPNGPESATVEQPGSSDDHTQRPNETEVEVSADVHPNTYKDIGPAHEDQAASDHDSGEAPTSSDNHGNADADKPDDGESVPDKKPQEDEGKDTEG